MVLQQTHFPLGNNSNNSGSGWGTYVFAMFFIVGVGYIGYQLLQKETITPALKNDKIEKQ